MTPPTPHPQRAEEHHGNVLCFGADVGSVDEPLNLPGNYHFHVDMVAHWREGGKEDGWALYRGLQIMRPKYYPKVISSHTYR